LNTHAPAFDPTAIERLVGELGASGFAVARHTLNTDLASALRREAEALPSDPARIDAGVGRNALHVLAPQIRQSTIKWLDGETPSQKAFLEGAEQIRAEINSRLFLGLFDFEAQLALYVSGGFYDRHVDSFSGARNRVVSLVAYLTPDWPADGGGELDIWDDRTSLGAPAASVIPEIGTLVLMMSEAIPHQVRVAHHPRASIAGWWRVRDA
jgi:SM-20-related protein